MQFDLNDNKENIPITKKGLSDITNKNTISTSKTLKLKFNIKKNENLKEIITKNKENNKIEKLNLALDFVNELNENKDNKEISSFKSKLILKEIINYKDYKQIESDLLLNKYGSNTFSYNKELEQKYLYNDILKNHSFASELRTKMIDWIIEVFAVFNYSDQTFFLSVHILDTYLNKQSLKNICIKEEEIHILGMIAMYLASKFEETRCLRMDFLYKNIGYETFSKEEIISRETEVIKVIGFENLIFASTTELIGNFFFDFELNNKSILVKNDFKNFIKALELFACYYAKLFAHFHIFSKYSSSLKAVSCIVLAFNNFEMEYGDSFSLKKEEIYYIKEWIRYIIDLSDFDNKIQEAHIDLVKALEIYPKYDFIKFNLDIRFKKSKEELLKN